MTAWVHRPGNFLKLGMLCINHTPITIIDAVDPTYTLDCIPISLCGDEYRIISEEDCPSRGFMRGELLCGDPEDIGDVIVREG